MASSTIFRDRGRSQLVSPTSATLERKRSAIVRRVARDGKQRSRARWARVRVYDPVHFAA